jgi:class 3 adenylate cyclase
VADIPNTGDSNLKDWAGGARATLAIVFTDIVGSTALGVALGDAGMSEVRRAHFAQSTALAARHAGRELKTIGDSVMAVFRSIEAALGYAQDLHLDPGHSELCKHGVRAGIHIGSVDVAESDIFGTEVAVAARVVHAIEGAEIWLSDRAKVDLDRGGARHLRHLQWTQHEGVHLKGVGEDRLWSLALTRATQAVLDVTAADQNKVEAAPRPAAAVSNIPDGMVPRHFMGRDDALGGIAAALEGDGGRVAITAPSVTALHGLRGVGKTVLAAAFAERHRADYRAAWWVRAETEAGVRADLVGLGVRLGWVASDEKEEPALAVIKERLRQEGYGILLIFDNARDVEALRSWLPSGGACRVIVTSNAPNWRAVATPIAIRVWPKETGADFLIERGRKSSAPLPRLYRKRSVACHWRMSRRRRIAIVLVCRSPNIAGGSEQRQRYCSTATRMLQPSIMTA